MEVRPDEGMSSGGAPPAFVAEVEKEADELLRAAAAFLSTERAIRERGERRVRPRPRRTLQLRHRPPTTNASASCRRLFSEGELLGSGGEFVGLKRRDERGPGMGGEHKRGAPIGL